MEAKSIQAAAQGSNIERPAITQAEYEAQMQRNELTMRAREDLRNSFLAQVRGKVFETLQEAISNDQRHVIDAVLGDPAAKEEIGTQRDRFHIQENHQLLMSAVGKPDRLLQLIEGGLFDNVDWPGKMAIFKEIIQHPDSFKMTVEKGFFSVSFLRKVELFGFVMADRLQPITQLFIDAGRNVEQLKLIIEAGFCGLEEEKYLEMAIGLQEYPESLRLMFSSGKVNIKFFLSQQTDQSAENFQKLGQNEAFVEYCRSQGKETYGRLLRDFMHCDQIHALIEHPSLVELLSEQEWGNEIEWIIDQRTAPVLRRVLQSKALCSVLRPHKEKLLEYVEDCTPCVGRADKRAALEKALSISEEEKKR